MIADGVYQNAKWRILCRGSIAYQGGKAAYDCLAISMITNNSMPSKSSMVSTQDGIEGIREPRVIVHASK